MRVHLPKALFALGALALLNAPAVRGADYRLIPSLSLSEEYNDNLFQRAHDERTEFVTRVQPSLALSAKGGGLACDLLYGIDYRYYARDSRSNEWDHRAAFKGSLSFLEDFLHIDLGDTYSRVATNVARDVVNESLVVDQTQQNAAYISPYLAWRLPGNSKLKTGYRYLDTRYWGGNGIDKIEHDGYAEWSRELSAGLVLSSGYSFARINAETSGLDRQELYAGLRYDYAPASFIYGKAGYNWQSFDSGNNTGDPFWDLGAGRDFGFLTATVGTKVQYTEDPTTLSTRSTSHYATVSRTFPRGAASCTASYSKYEKDQALLPDVQRKVLLSANGRYELRPDLTLLLSLSGDRLRRSLGTEYPYHLYGNLALDYVLSTHLTLAASYSRISYRDELDSAAGSTEVNRAIVEMRLSL